MGLFRGILDAVSAWTISDKFGSGAGFLYADFAAEKASERELDEMKSGVSEIITDCINENRKLFNHDLIQDLHRHLDNIASCNRYNAKARLSDLQYFFDHKCAYFCRVIEILNNALESLESVLEDDLDEGVKSKVILKTKEVINCSDENLMPEKLKELFSFYAENGVNIENVAELFDNFETWRKEYLT